MKYCRTRSSAKKKGRLYYKTGNPCSSGHISHRYTSTGRCVDCDRIHTQSRRDVIKKQTPKWSCLLTIKSIYDSVETGYSVDHIIPLRAELVSGLHVPENLQVIPLNDNLAKKNSFCINNHIN